MGKVDIKIRHAEMPDFESDARWMHEVGAASDQEVLGKWALYYALLDDGLVSQESLGTAQKTFAMLDFERRYRDGDFNETEKEALSGPSKYDVPSQIFRAMCALYTYPCDTLPEDGLKDVLSACDDIKERDDYELLSGDQQQALQAIIQEVSYSLHKRGTTMALKEQ
jgi:hypothetical protein